MPTIAGYCVRVRVKLGSSILDGYSHWIPSMGRNIADRMDAALRWEHSSGPLLLFDDGSGSNRKET